MYCTLLCGSFISNNHENKLHSKIIKERLKAYAKPIKAMT